MGCYGRSGLGTKVSTQVSSQNRHLPWLKCNDIESGWQLFMSMMARMHVATHKDHFQRTFLARVTAATDGAVRIMTAFVPHL